MLHTRCSSVPRRFQQCQDPAGAEIQCWSWSLDLLSHRRTEWFTGRRAVGIMRGSDSTVTLGMMARPTLSSTPLESTDSESLEVTIFLAGDRPRLRTRT